MTKFRTEKDSLGTIKVPAKAYYGAQTQRAVENFEIGWAMDLNLIFPYIIIKKAAAISNHAQKRLSKKLSNAIVKACDDILENPEDFIDQFPVSVFQSGSGTQTNMNVNEVVANKANELLGGKLGEYKFIYPNDHVNMSQSTNDTFPSAILIGCVLNVEDNLLPSLEILKTELSKKEKEFKSIIKVGRTHLQDATPITLGQEFSGYNSQLSKCIQRIELALEEIYFVAQGGTAVGTGLNTKKGFDKKIIAELRKFTKLPFKPAPNKFAALAAHDAIVNFSGTMNTTAVCLMKIANDIRFLGSGPRAGYGELILPENEPGSSIMPGKINPTQCEAVTMVCVKVIGNHNGITIAGSHGHFELNVFKPLIIHNILQSIHIMADSSKSFANYCIKGLKADKKRIKNLLDNSLMLVTALSPKVGYDNAARIAKKAHKNGTTLKEESIKSGLITEKEYDKIVDPKKMIKPQ